MRGYASKFVKDVLSFGDFVNSLLNYELKKNRKEAQKLWSLAEAKHSFSSPYVQTDPGADPVSYPVGTGAVSLEAKRGWGVTEPLTPI